MSNIRIVLSFLAVFVPARLCAAEYTEIIPQSVLDFTERGAFTSDGRFFVIGVRPADVDTLKGSLVEVVREGDAFSVRDVVAGTLEGTSDGRIGGPQAGDACVFSGMASHGTLLYAGCSTIDGRASLLEIDVAKGTVRAGYLDACDIEPGPCEAALIYANGMSVDAEGRIYVSNTAAHVDTTGPLPVLRDDVEATISQIVIDADGSDATHLVFDHRPWFGTNILSESFVPNGVEIEGNALYYAAGPNVNRVEIEADGSAGDAKVYYVGTPLTYIDDFAVHDGVLTLARTIDPSIATVRPAPVTGIPVLSDILPVENAPSSATRVPPDNALFGGRSFITTAYYGGGVYTL